MFTVEPLGLSGGLSLFYMDEFQVNILFLNNRMIDIEAVTDRTKCFMKFSWECLTCFSTTRTGPWFMIGDFNEITGHNEKEGGSHRSDSSFLPFKHMLSDCGMFEFPFTGNMLS